METRVERRRRTFAKALLITNPGEPAVECTVRDITASGVGLWLQGVTALPKRFELMIPGANVRVKVQLVWQSGQKIGVAFVGSSAVPLKHRVAGGKSVAAAAMGGAPA